MFHVEPEESVKDILAAGLSELGLRLPSEFLNKVETYFKLLVAKNSQLNLISPKQDLKTKVAVHLIDSLTPLLWDNWPHECQALDIGSGGGLPAIILSLYFSDWSFTLCEATAKKASFLLDLKEKLSLNNVKILNTYLQAGRNKENFSFDFICARAVTNLAKLSELAGPRLVSGGILLAFKGPLGEQEFKEAQSNLKKNKFRLLDRLDFKLPIVEARRSLFLLEKRY